MQIPQSRSDKLKVRDESPVHLTEEGFKHLREKLTHLEGLLPNLIDEAKRTAAYGDRSDSAEYKDAKSTLRRTHRQILSTKDQIKRVVIIKSGPNTSGTVQLGSVVVLEVVDSAHSTSSGQALRLDSGQAGSPEVGSQKTFQIVGSRETDPARGRISHQSPLGAALMSHAKGDIVEGGSQKYRILEIQ